MHAYYEKKPETIFRCLNHQTRCLDRSQTSDLRFQMSECSLGYFQRTNPDVWIPNQTSGNDYFSLFRLFCVNFHCLSILAILLIVITYYRLWWHFLHDFREYPFWWIRYRFLWILFTSSNVNFYDWLFLQSILWFVTLKYKGFNTSSKYQNSLIKTISTLFYLQSSFFSNRFPIY